MTAEEENTTEHELNDYLFSENQLRYDMSLIVVVVAVDFDFKTTYTE